MGWSAGLHAAAVLLCLQAAAVRAAPAAKLRGLQSQDVARARRADSSTATTTVAAPATASTVGASTTSAHTTSASTIRAATIVGSTTMATVRYNHPQTLWFEQFIPRHSNQVYLTSGPSSDFSGRMPGSDEEPYKTGYIIAGATPPRGGSTKDDVCAFIGDLCQVIRGGHAYNPGMYRNTIILVRWTPESSCSAYELGKFADDHSALAVINIGDAEGTHVARNTTEGGRPNLMIPFVTLAHGDGESVCRNYDSFTTKEIQFGRILSENPKPDPLKLPENMMTVAMAAPLVIFVFLIVSRLMRASRVHAYRQLHQEQEAATQERMQNMRRDFVEALPLKSVKDHLATLQDPEAYEPDSCTICLDDLNEEDMVRILPCPCRYFFHKDCIDPWLLDNGSCPTCKFDFDIPDSDSEASEDDSSEDGISTGDDDDEDDEGSVDTVSSDDDDDDEDDDDDDDDDDDGDDDDDDDDDGSSGGDSHVANAASSSHRSNHSASVYENVTDEEDASDDELLEVPLQRPAAAAADSADDDDDDSETDEDSEDAEDSDE